MQYFKRIKLYAVAAVVGVLIGGAGLALTQNAARAETTRTHTVSNYRSAFAQKYVQDVANRYVYGKSVMLYQIGSGNSRVSRFMFTEYEYDYSSWPFTINQRISTGVVPNSDLRISSASATLTVDTTEDGFMNFGRGDWAGWSGGEFEVDISKLNGGETIHDPYKFEFEYVINGTTYSYKYIVNAKQDEAECDITLDGDDLFEDGTDRCAISRTNSGLMRVIETED